MQVPLRLVSARLRLFVNPFPPGATRRSNKKEPVHVTAGQLPATPDTMDEDERCVALPTPAGQPAPH